MLRHALHRLDGLHAGKCTAANAKYPSGIEGTPHTGSAALLRRCMFVRHQVGTAAFWLLVGYLVCQRGVRTQFTTRSSFDTVSPWRFDVAF